MKQYKCSVCGYIYNSVDGDKDGGIIPGTDFSMLPEDWTCPVCRVEKSKFVEISDAEDNVSPHNESRIEEVDNISDYNKNSNENCDL